MKVSIYWDERYPSLWMSPAKDGYKGDRELEVTDEIYQDWVRATDLLDSVEGAISRLEEIARRQEDRERSLGPDAVKPTAVF